MCFPLIFLTTVHIAFKEVRWLTVDTNFRQDAVLLALSFPCYGILAFILDHMLEIWVTFKLLYESANIRPKISLRSHHVNF